MGGNEEAVGLRAISLPFPSARRRSTLPACPGYVLRHCGEGSVRPAFELEIIGQDRDRVIHTLPVPEQARASERTTVLRLRRSTTLPPSGCSLRASMDPEGKLWLPDLWRG